GGEAARPTAGRQRGEPRSPGAGHRDQTTAALGQVRWPTGATATLRVPPPTGFFHRRPTLSTNRAARRSPLCGGKCPPPRTPRRELLAARGIAAATTRPAADDTPGPGANNRPWWPVPWRVAWRSV